MTFEDTIDFAGPSLILALERIRPAETEHARDYCQFIFIARQRVCLGVIRHLELVLNIAQKYVRVRQSIAFVARDECCVA